MRLMLALLISLTSLSAFAAEDVRVKVSTSGVVEGPKYMLGQRAVYSEDEKKKILAYESTVPTSTITSASFTTPTYSRDENLKLLIAIKERMTACDDIRDDLVANSKSTVELDRMIDQLRNNYDAILERF
jgi:hypothetical protein